MNFKIGLIASAVLAFVAQGSATSCTATVTVTVTSSITDCGGPVSSTSYYSSLASTTILAFNSSSSVYGSVTSTKSRRPHHHHSHHPDPNNDPTTSPSSWASTSTSQSSKPSPTRLDCQPDNCLRAFENTDRFPEASSFCATYTASVNTATTGLPEPITNCEAKPFLISSACSCINTDLVPPPTPPPSTTGVPVVSSNSITATPHSNSTVTTSASLVTSNGTVSSTTAPTLTNTQLPKQTLPLDCQPDNCLRAFENKEFLGGPDFCAIYTAGPSTPTEIPDHLRNCEANPTYLASACSCINASLPGAIGYSTPGPLPTTTTSNPSSMATRTQESPTTITSVTSSDQTSTPVPDPYVSCHQDNCFRQAIQAKDSFSSFCSTYTTAVATATSGLPPFVALCSQPAVISSVCSCIVTATGSGTPLSTTTPGSNNNGGGTGGGNDGVPTSSNAAASSCAAVTIIYETHTEIATILTTVSALSSSASLPTSFSLSTSVVTSTITRRHWAQL